MSRRAGEGTHNYVIFDDQDVNIRAKYSLRPVEHTPEFRAFFGDWEIAASQPARAASTFEEARAHAATFLNQPLVNRASGIVAQVSGGSLKKMLNAKAVAKSESPAAHALAVANLDDLFARAVLGWSKPDEHGDSNIRAIHRFFAPMMRGDRPMLAKLTVKETAQVNRANPLYTVEAVEFNEKSPAAQWVGEIADADGIDPRTTRSAGDIQTLARRVQDFQPDAVSKVVDADGRPLVVYHGTTKPPFTRFDPARSPAELHGAYFFTDDPDTADFHAQGRWRWAGQPQPMGGHVYPVYLNLRNPMRVDDQKIGEPELEAEMIDDAIRAGHDGIIATNEQTGERTFIVFDPRQIKSATGNRGTFDPKDPDLRYSLRPVDQQLANDARRQLRAIADGGAIDFTEVHLPSLQPHLSRALAAAGLAVPAHTPQVASVERVRHAIGHPARLTADELAAMPDVVSAPDWIGTTTTRGFKRVYFLKQNGGDKLYIAVYGRRRGRLGMVTFYTEAKNRILEDFKNKGVPLVTVANSAVRPDEGEPGRPTPGLFATEGTPETPIIDAPRPPGKENPPDLQFSRRPGEYYTPDESPRRGGRPTRSPEAPSPRPAGPAAPVGPRNPQPGDFAGTPAQTPTGRKLLARLAKDAAGRKVGPRAIVDWLHEQLGTFVVVGKTNTTRRHPAHYSTRWHYVRSRAGQWSLNVHEAGHARSAIRRMALTDQRPVGGMRSAGQSNGPELKRWMRK